ncbi:MAG: hypothetical protein SOV38_01365 [Prevotella sp.]|nr:hypothetical protein [Prevotella sp.]
MSASHFVIIGIRKDVGIPTLAYPGFRPSHCHHSKISNAVCPRRDILSLTYATMRMRI